MRPLENRHGRRECKGRTDARPIPTRVSALEDLEDNEGSLGGEPCRWAERAAKCQQAVSDKSIEGLARKWGVSAESLKALGVGFDGTAFTFPMLDGEGRIVGLRRRFRTGDKAAVDGSTNGLFIPEASSLKTFRSLPCVQGGARASALSAHRCAEGVAPGNVQLICEGESDTAAALTLGFTAVGRPGATACNAEVVRLLGGCPVAFPCIVADNSDQERAGAERLSDDLVAAGIPCRVVWPPEGIKDLRKWVRQGLTADELRKHIGQAEPRWPDVKSWPPGFASIPNALLRRGIVARIGEGPWALACLLASFGKHGIPPREKLAALLGVSPATVDRWKGVLKRAGMAWWRRGRTGRANEYTVTFGPERWRHSSGARRP